MNINLDIALEIELILSYSIITAELLANISTVDSSLTNFPVDKLLNIPLYGSKYFSVKTSKSILKSTIKFLKKSERFDDILFLLSEK